MPAAALELVFAMDNYLLKKLGLAQPLGTQGGLVPSARRLATVAAVAFFSFDIDRGACLCKHVAEGNDLVFTPILTNYDCTLT